MPLGEVHAVLSLQGKTEAYVSPPWSLIRVDLKIKLDSNLTPDYPGH